MVDISIDIEIRGKLVERLKKAGAETPYELTGLAETTQLLMQYGLDAEEAYNSTMQLGDISQGSAEKNATYWNGLWSNEFGWKSTFTRY